MSTLDMLQPPPAPARAHKRYGPHWFRLVVIALILSRILAALPGLAWARLAGLWRSVFRAASRR